MRGSRWPGCHSDRPAPPSRLRIRRRPGPRSRPRPPARQPPRARTTHRGSGLPAEPPRRRRLGPSPRPANRCRAPGHVTRADQWWPELARDAAGGSGRSQSPAAGSVGVAASVGAVGGCLRARFRQVAGSPSATLPSMALPDRLRPRQEKAGKEESRVWLAFPPGGGGSYCLFLPLVPLTPP